MSVRSVQSRPPVPALRNYVRAFAQRTVTGAFPEQPMPAYLETIINFDFADLPTIWASGRGLEHARRYSVVGPHTFKGTGLQFDGHVDSFAIFLHPTALWTLFRVRVSEVMEASYDADDVLGPSVLDLWDALGNQPGFADRCAIAERFLIAEIADNQPTARVIVAANVLARSGGKTRIETLSSQLAMSRRQLERCFQIELGISPKRYARIARFQAALDSKVVVPSRTWLDISTEAGYFDQMHLIHEFQELAGFSPTETINLLGDSRPAALVVQDRRTTGQASVSY